jgi:DNA-directed RNA polymerase subunit M/transcription elongation factor TFIIS
MVKKYKNMHAADNTLSNTRELVQKKLIALNPEKLKKMRNFEVAIYNFSVQFAKEKSIPNNWNNIVFRRVYLNKSRSIISNLGRDKELLKMSGVDMVNMNRETIAPDVWKEAIRCATRKRDMMFVARPKNDDGLFTCECNSKNTTFHQYQSRGADEPMTVHITCHDCDTIWKE